MILLDTNVISEFFKPRPETQPVQWFKSAAATPLYLSMISQAELLHGVACLPPGKRRAKLTSDIEHVLSVDFAGRILVFDDAASRAYAGIAAERRKRGAPISQHDCQIASIALTQGFRLATRNVKDFKYCGIELIDPWAEVRS